MIKNIINKTVTTISNCESEPIRIPGAIQPHGALIALNKETLIIDFCSANTSYFVEVEPDGLLGKPLKDALPFLWEQMHELINSGVPDKNPLTIKGVSEDLDIIIHTTDSVLIIEMELAYRDYLSGSKLYRQTEELVRIIERSGSLQQLCHYIAEQTREITGFDRVMIYRFDKDYHGEVFAESKVNSLDSFLGLYYPNTDIPQQARELYLQNLLRLIVDVNYQPVPLMTLDEGKEKNLDLSDATLRSVSPIHIQYLKNMNVASTLTISVLLEGKLWGLIACHHKQPRKLSFAQRQVALMQGHFLSSQIRVRQAADEYAVALQVEAHLQSLLNQVELDQDFPLKFDLFTSLLELTNATGAVVMYKGALYEKGLVPPKEKTIALIYWLADNIKSVHFSTSCLSSRYPGGDTIRRWASGIIYQSLGKPKENCIIWFREELEKTVEWAGNPHKPMTKDPSTNMLMPRSSFEIWKEKVQLTSKEWRVPEINVSVRFSNALQNYFHLLHLQVEEHRQRVMNEKLLKANEELANITWITSHDLQEPLRKIQIFASRTLLDENIKLSATIGNNIAKIQHSALRMQTLIKDIVNYSMLQNGEDLLIPIDLNEVLNEVKKDFSEEIIEKNAIINSEYLPTVVFEFSQAKQLFANIISNALKFSKNDVQLTIEIECRKVKGQESRNPLLINDKDYYKISIADNGIGFEQKYNKKIFDIFYRLHVQKSYSGTGMGLAIARKIIENHKGAIMATGELEVGAIFSFYLPVEK